MKDFVKESWKIAAAFATGAFLLSLLIGLITRNPFGVVLLRAFLLGLLFAALGVGLRFVVRTYLPELAGEPAKTPAAPADDPRGSRVDIVLEDETPPGRETGQVDTMTPVDAEEEPGEAAAGDVETAQAEAQALGELAEELADDASGEESTERAESAETVESESGDEPSELPSGAESSSAGPGSSEMDSLPDLDPLDTPAEEAEKGVRPLPRARRDTPGDAVREKMARQDPATLARALRTVLKKDEKG